MRARLLADCALQLPVAPPRRAPPDLHLRLYARHDALPSRQAEGHGANELLLEVRTYGGTAESVRELMLRGYGCKYKLSAVRPLWMGIRGGCKGGVPRGARTNVAQVHLMIGF